MLEPSTAETKYRWSNIYTAVSKMLQIVTPTQMEENQKQDLITLLVQLNERVLATSFEDSSYKDITVLIKQLKVILKMLSDARLEECHELLLPFLSKLQERLNYFAIEKMVVPHKIMKRKIAPYLRQQELLNLSYTCFFFSGDSDLKEHILRRTVQVANVGDHTFVLRNNQLYKFGRNGYGEGERQLGDTCESTPKHILISDDKRIRQIGVGEQHIIVLCQDGTLYSFGWNRYGQLGLENRANQSTPQPITLLEGNNAKQIFVTGAHTFVLCKDGALYGFGFNGAGQLGLGNYDHQLTPQRVTLPEGQVKRVFIGKSHTLILCKDGLLYSFGSNSYGELGLGNFVGQPTPQLVTLPDNKKAKQVFMGKENTFVLCEDDTLYGFGRNSVGQLGIGNVVNQFSPQLINLPEGKKAKRVHPKERRTIVLCEDGTFYGFGKNKYGQLGLGASVQNQTTPRQILLPEGIKAKKIIVGFQHNIILCESGELYSFGGNVGGELGLENHIDQFTPKQIALPDDKKARDVFVGTWTTFVLCEDSTLCGFGYNEYGQLGLGNTENQYTPQLISREDDTWSLKKIIGCTIL